MCPAFLVLLCHSWDGLWCNTQVKVFGDVLTRRQCILKNIGGAICLMLFALALWYVFMHLEWYDYANAVPFVVGLYLAGVWLFALIQCCFYQPIAHRDNWYGTRHIGADLPAVRTVDLQEPLLSPGAHGNVARNVQVSFVRVWEAGLDGAAQRAIRAATAKLSRASPMGTPVGSTPAGNYVGVYWQYGRSHIIPAQALRCTSTNDDGTVGVVEGHGFDDVGHFRVSGSYEGVRLALTKQYIAGTGDRHENRGHSVSLRLTLCDVHEVLPDQSHFFSRHGAPPGTVGFYGTWHVRTRGYSGDAEMVLWMPPGPPVVVGHAVRPGEFERFAAAVPIASGQPVPAGVAAVAGRAGMPTVEAVGVPVPVERSSSLEALGQMAGRFATAVNTAASSAVSAITPRRRADGIRSLSQPGI